MNIDDFFEKLLKLKEVDNVKINFLDAEEELKNIKSNSLNNKD
jgi:hypothetical protein